MALEWTQYGTSEGEPIMMHPNRRIRLMPMDGAYLVQEQTSRGWARVPEYRAFATVEKAMLALEDYWESSF